MPGQQSAQTNQLELTDAHANPNEIEYLLTMTIKNNGSTTVTLDSSRILLNDEPIWPYGITYGFNLYSIHFPDKPRQRRAAQLNHTKTKRHNDRNRDFLAERKILLRNESRSQDPNRQRKPVLGNNHPFLSNRYHHKPVCNLVSSTLDT